MAGVFRCLFAFTKVQTQIVAEMPILFYTVSGIFITFYYHRKEPGCTKNAAFLKTMSILERAKLRISVQVVALYHRAKQ